MEDGPTAVVMGSASVTVVFGHFSSYDTVVVVVSDLCLFFRLYRRLSRSSL